MKYAFFKGCKMPHYQPDYEKTTRLVMGQLGVELVDLEFNCCGHQVKDQDTVSFLYAAIRNIAVAETEGFTIMTPCKCCIGNLMNAVHTVDKDPSLKKEITKRLADEKLIWTGIKKPVHLLSVLRHEIGIAAIEKQVVRKMTEYSVATHYGCHALRPSNVMQFDNPFSPVIFEELIHATGAETVDWSRRLECCGNPILEKNRALSVKMMQNKFEDAAHSGADYICTACTYCQIQFEAVRKEENLRADYPEALLYTKLLALSFGLVQS